MLLALLACARADVGPCKDDQLSKVATAVNLVGKADHPPIAAMGLAESCTFSPALQEGLATVAQVMPEQRTRLVLRAVSTDGLAFEAACPGGVSMLAQAMALTPAARGQRIVEVCKPDFVRSGETPGDMVLLAILARKEMASEDTTARTTILRALSGF